MGTDDGTALAERPTPAATAAEWVSLVDAQATGSRPAPPSVGTVVGRFVLANLVAVALLLAGSVWASRQAARDEAIADARHATDLLATLLVEPNADDALATGDPRAVTRLDAVLRDRMASADVLRIKIWTPEGRVVYSDEPRLIGMVFPLDEENAEALRDGTTRAELSELSKPENRFERSAGQLLEVYRRIQTHSGDPLLLEAYSSYRDATSRQMDIWFKFAPISMLALLALLAMQLPLAHRMAGQLRGAQRERELLQQRALDTSTEERRRIAGSLHDGIVQDVSASSLLVAGVADQLGSEAYDDCAPPAADVLGDAAVALRESVGALRSLLVEISPPNLERAGLFSALADLAARLRLRGIEVDIAVPQHLDVPLETAALVFRTAQEALLNVAKHARARTVEVTVSELPGRLVLEVADDGAGFDLAATRRTPRCSSLGLSLLADLAAADGARLDVRTAPGAGTTLRLETPLP